MKYNDTLRGAKLLHASNIIQAVCGAICVLFIVFIAKAKNILKKHASNEADTAPRLCEPATPEPELHPLPTQIKITRQIKETNNA